MTEALVLAVGAVGFGLITMLVAYTLVNGTLNREIRAARAGRYAPEIGYRRYIAASLGIVRYAVLIALIVPLVSVLVLITNEDALAQLVSDVPVASVFGIGMAYVFCLFGVLYSIPFSTYDLLTVPMGVRALAELRGMRLAAREVLAYRIKRVLVVFGPIFALFEATGAVALASVGVALGVLIVGLIAVVFLRRAFATALMQWTIPSLPIERTQWAALGLRIHEWGRLAGVNMKAVYVQQTGHLGAGSIAAVGSRRARVLFIGDGLLAGTDWRQQDALFVQALNSSGSVAIGRRGVLIRTLVLLGVVALALGISAALLLTAQSGATISPVALLAIALLSLALFLGLVVFSIFNAIYARRRTRQRFMAADARTAAITGDPLALMVALNTLNALSGAPNDRRAGYLPSTADRVGALDALLRQPGPRAPFAWQLVPSIVPVYVGPYCLTVPLASAQPAPPAPVPAGPYPVVMPPATTPVAMPAPCAPRVPPVPPIQYPSA